MPDASPVVPPATPGKSRVADTPAELDPRELYGAAAFARYAKFLQPQASAQLAADSHADGSKGARNKQTGQPADIQLPGTPKRGSRAAKRLAPLTPAGQSLSSKAMQSSMSPAVERGPSQGAWLARPFSGGLPSTALVEAFSVHTEVQYVSCRHDETPLNEERVFLKFCAYKYWRCAAGGSDLEALADAAVNGGAQSPVFTLQDRLRQQQAEHSRQQAEQRALVSDVIDHVMVSRPSMTLSSLFTNTCSTRALLMLTCCACLLSKALMAASCAGRQGRSPSGRRHWQLARRKRPRPSWCTRGGLPCQ